MLDRLSSGFSSEHLKKASEKYDLHDRETRPLFAALSTISFLKKVEEESPDDLESCENVWKQAYANNLIFVGEIGESLTTFLFGTEMCLMLSYMIDTQTTKWEVLSEEYHSVGKMAVFFMGQFKELGIIRRYLRVDPAQCNDLYQSIKITIDNQQCEDEPRVFSYENWKLVYGNYPFNHALLTQLQSCDGEEVVQTGNSFLGNKQFILKSRKPMTSFGIIATRCEGGNDLNNDEIRNNHELASLILSTQMEILLPIPYSFSTPALLMTKQSLSFAMVSPSREKQGFYTIESEEEYPFTEFLPTFFEKIDEDRRNIASGLVDDDESKQVYLLNLDQIQRYASLLLSPQRRNMHEIDVDNALQYFGFLKGFNDEYKMDRAKEKYENDCLSILSAIGNEKYAIKQDIIRKQQEERRIQEERRHLEVLRRQEEKNRKQAEFLKAQSGSMIPVNTFHTKLAGVTHSNTGSNTESRQKIIRDLLRSGMLNSGQELRLVQEPTNPYDNHAVAVFGPDGRQLGYLPKDVARRVFDDMNRGTTYKISVSAVTGGSVSMAYGVNVKVEGYTQETTSYYSPVQPSYSDSRYCNDGIDYSEFEDINSTARSEGFSIDEDGHWFPMDNDYEY